MFKVNSKNIMISSDLQSQIFETNIWRPEFGHNGPKSDLK